jgi:very-short-patch-repair endonuclease
MLRNAGDLAVVANASRRHGIVTARELHAAGLSRHAIANRVARGWLRRIHRGVFLVGAVPGPWSFEAAALAAAGPRAALGHRSAAAVWGLCQREAGPVDVVVPGSPRGHDGIRTHRAQLESRDITRRHDLRVTTADRTLLDLAATLPRADLDRAVNEALVQQVVTVGGLRRYVARDPGRRGAAALAAVLHEHRGITRSEGERRLKALIRRARLPQPVTNVRVAGYEVDCFWPALALVVEVDSAGFHGTPAAFQADRAKEAALNDAGLRLVRVTRWEVVHEAEPTIARLARATAARPP